MSSIFKHSQPSSSKVIGLKPITFETPLNLDDVDEEETKRAIKEKLDHAVAELDQAKQEAQAIIDQARQQIELEKQQWTEERQHLEEAAKEQGFQEGFQQGEQAGRQEYEMHMEQAREIIQIAQDDAKSTVLQSEETILHLGLKAAERILHQEIEQPEQYLSIVKAVLHEVKGQTKVAIYTNPDQYPLILSNKEELKNIVQENVELAVYPDEGLSIGSCIIESPFGRIDAGIESQLHELRNKLFDIAQEAGREHK
ncbi:flagellar assembly protein FliH [Radiobacillus kanasensis]|uniref:flagellar assembly protein FliH n=1 Tax=Radiobacillus kanasensis TaxID=2844358 RepID=UPI001E44245F|nr:flagellar assembly protein FliH [Radiobacillus kanasensis]UFU01024.1 flagellar assembly protein FliH [Radiobacillus kanasensis]